MRRLLRTCLIAATLLATAAFVAALALPPGDCSVSATPLTVMTYNVGDSIPTKFDSKKLTSLLRELGPVDVILLQEFQGGRNIKTFASQLGYPYYAVLLHGPRQRYFQAILSRFPITATRNLPFKATREHRSALAASLDIGGREVLVVNLHLDPVPKRRHRGGMVDITTGSLLRILYREFLVETPRSLEVNQVLKWLARQPEKTVIIGGDFNTVPLSVPLRRMAAKLNDALWPSLAFFQGSYAKIDLWLKPRVDHLFVSEDVEVCNAHVIQRTLGDHYPVVGEFGLTGTRLAGQ